MVVRGDPLASVSELWRERPLQVLTAAHLLVHLLAEHLVDLEKRIRIILYSRNQGANVVYLKSYLVLEESVLFESGVEDELHQEEERVAEGLGHK